MSRPVKSEGFLAEFVLPAKTSVDKIYKKLKSSLPTGTDLKLSVTTESLNTQNKDIDNE